MNPFKRLLNIIAPVIPYEEHDLEAARLTLDRIRAKGIKCELTFKDQSGYTAHAWIGGEPTRIKESGSAHFVCLLLESTVEAYLKIRAIRSLDSEIDELERLEAKRGVL